MAEKNCLYFTLHFYETQGNWCYHFSLSLLLIKIQFKMIIVVVIVVTDCEELSIQIIDLNSQHRSTVTTAAKSGLPFLQVFK